MHQIALDETVMCIGSAALAVCYRRSQGERIVSPYALFHPRTVALTDRSRRGVSDRYEVEDAKLPVEYAP